MIVEIDTDKLKAREATLQEELSHIASLLMLAENYSRTPAAPTHPKAVSLPPVPLPPVKHEPTRGFTAGLRRAVILSLHTGPCTERDLSKALVWTLGRTKTVLGSMLRFRICFLTEHGTLALSEEGKRQAVWYIAHPEKLTYRPNR